MGKIPLDKMGMGEKSKYIGVHMMIFPFKGITQGETKLKSVEDMLFYIPADSQCFLH